MKTISRKEYNQFFTSAKRSDNTVFFKLNDEAPEELRDFVREIHIDYFAGCLPNDWLYEQIMDAFDALTKDALDDILLGYDAYSSDLYKWFGNSYASWICDDAREEFGNNGSIDEQIGDGQLYAKRMIYRAVNQFIEADRESEDEGEIE